MPAYLIADMKSVSDPEKLKQYHAGTPDTIAAHGGRFIVRGGAAETIEGDWTPGRMVVIEFPDMDALKGWWNSPEYDALKPLRHTASESDLIFVEGFDG